MIALSKIKAKQNSKMQISKVKLQGLAWGLTDGEGQDKKIRIYKLKRKRFYRAFMHCVCPASAKEQ
jgi:hypothetical protein